MSYIYTTYSVGMSYLYQIYSFKNVIHLCNIFSRNVIFIPDIFI